MVSSLKETSPHLLENVFISVSYFDIFPPSLELQS